MSSSPSRSRQSTPQLQPAQPSPTSTVASVATIGSGSSKTSFRGMMQAYGYFIWFATQRIVPRDGVVCMITASQWLTLEFAINLRGWLMEHCLVDELFQFEPYKVFARVQTDSLIFKLRSHATDMYHDDSTTTDPDQPYTLFLRHLDSRSSLKSTLNDYTAFADHLLASQRHRAGTAAAETIATETLLPSLDEEKHVTELTKRIAYAFKSHATLKNQIRQPTFSFAPMMPSTALSEYLLTLTANLGGLCTAGTKRASRQSSTEPLLWHRGPNTNPVYGLVLRMEYALATFGEVATQKWFRPALYWNGKNAPDGPDAAEPPAATTLPTTTTTVTPSASTTTSNYSSKSRGAAGYGSGGLEASTTTVHDVATTTSSEGNVASSMPASPALTVSTPPRPMPPGLHREGQFWFYRDRQRLSRKEGSPAESYLIPKPENERLYVLCMVDKEAAKVLRKEAEEGVEGSKALWQYLHDVRNHFQPGLVNKRAAAAAASAATAPNGQTASNRFDEDSIAYCSTSQCGADIASKIIHPINYGYFSKSQPRQRFFLDTSSTAVTNQCIYLTPNNVSVQNGQQPPLTYFLTLLNTTMLQYFVLRHCQYDQQGRMRLFRESMAKIPYQSDIYPERVQYATQLGEHMMQLKEALYAAVSRLGLGQLGILEWIRRGGEASPVVVASLRDHLRVRNEQGLLVGLGSRARTATAPPPPSGAVSVLSSDPVHLGQIMAPSSAMEVDISEPDPSDTRMMSDQQLDQLVKVLTRAIGTVDLLQWAVDQYGYMLYGVGPPYQQMLEEELKIVYDSHIIHSQGNLGSSNSSSTTITPKKEDDSSPMPNRFATADSSIIINRSSSHTPIASIDSSDDRFSPTQTLPGSASSFHHHHRLSTELYRWDAAEPSPGKEGKGILPAYASHVLEEASQATRDVLRFL
ncbi:hypothetical protein DFQ27_007168 [Actinomortierella ambigua]|uniref:Type II methyltransferase M.TaqI-like domain-containing protein n=1 Tax=Actinomortierella ambigua TaxID=1343610 RepID=A0A9P6PWZ5_9FUNG|nr:hypothetical protein DFQ27_007168 [Actinomortierella ambigua]